MDASMHFSGPWESVPTITTSHSARRNRAHLKSVIPLLFSADDLAEMMGQAGLQVVQRFGSYAGDELGRDAPRAIIVAQRQ